MHRTCPLGGKADATIVVANIIACRATSYRNRASEQVAPRKARKKDNRQHDADHNNQHISAHRSLLRDGQSWMTSDSSDTALRGWAIALPGVLTDRR